MSKTEELHAEFLREPLSRQKAQAAIRGYTKARADIEAAKQRQRDLYEEVMACKREMEAAEAREQLALENIIRGYGHVPFEIEGVYYDIAGQGEKLYGRARANPGKKLLEKVIRK